MSGSSDFPNHSAADKTELRAQAKLALERGDFDWIERLLDQGQLDLASLTENLRIYQAELEVQNAELREAQAAAERMAMRYTTLFSAMPLAQMVIDRNGLIIDANDQANRLFNLRDRHRRHHFLQRLVLKSDKHSLADVLAQARHSGVSAAAEMRFLTVEGRVFGGELHIAPLASEGELLAQFICAVVDLSEQLRQQEELRLSEEKLAFLAHHDALTHLPNRALMQDRLAQGVSRANRHHDVMAVLFIDLDRFKDVNDRLGHAVGDELLREAALRMLQQLRGSDTLARVGGDEFVVLLEDANCARRAGAVANKLLAELQTPFRLRQQELRVTASIGISLYPVDGVDPDVLLRHADMAMYKAKALGRSTFQFYHAEMSSGVVAHLDLTNALRGALARQELVLHYQPQVSLETGDLIGVEALLRWQHPDLGLLAPGRFIPIAEEMGVIADIGVWVLRTACAQVARWRASGLDIPRVAVNLVIQQLEREAFVDLVAEVLRENAVEPGQLELEVSEAMILNQGERARLNLRGLRALGVGVSVDDFGAGCSSLGFIQHLPVNQLKIDRSFVDDIGRDPDDEVIVRAIIGLGHSLGLEVVAAGIERAEQAEFLSGEGCRVGQGFFYSRAVPAQEIRRGYPVAGSRG